MAKFGIRRAPERLRTSGGVGVRANIDVRQGPSLGAAIGQAGLAVAGELQRGSARKEAIQARNRKNLDSLSAREADVLRKQTGNAINEMKIKTPPEKWEEEATKIVTDFNGQISGLDFSPEESAKQQILSDGDLSTVPNEAFIAGSRVISKATIKIEEERLTDDYRIGRDDIAQRKVDFIKSMKNNGVSAPDILLKLRAAKEAGEKLRADDAIEDIKPNLVTAIEETGRKDEAIGVLNTSTGELVESGVLTEAEGAEANKVLGDWIDNYVAGRIKQGKEAEKLITRESYESLIPTLFDDTKARLRFDEVDRSKLLKADKEKWQSYIKGSYKDAPTENTPEGHDFSFNAAFDAATLQKSPTEAYDSILSLRFVDQSITDEQFQWAFGKIQDPYPRDVFEDLNVITTSNLKDFNRWLKKDNERNKDVNEALVEWVDRQIEKDKVPTKKEMHAISSQFRVGNDRWFDIGQEINRGGRRWEVVGFDENGEPLVEAID